MKKNNKQEESLQQQILALLRTAGPEGMSIIELSQKLSTPTSGLLVWFSKIGKKLPEIQKVGEARYAIAPASAETPPPQAEPIHHLDVSLIDPSPFNHREDFPADYIASLGKSIQTHGNDNPVIVRPSPRTPGRYELIAGECRLRAAHLYKIPALRGVIRDVDDREAKRIQAAENLQRKDLTPLESARALRNLLDAGEKPAAVMAQFGLSKSTLYGKLKLLDLPAKAQTLLREGKLSESIAIDLARLEGAVQTSALAAVTDRHTIDAPYREQKAALDRVAEDAKEIEAWQEVVRAEEAKGHTVLAYEECRPGRIYLTEAFCNDYSRSEDPLERLAAKCHQDPKQRTFENIIGAERLAANPQLVVIGRCQSSGKPVRLMRMSGLFQLCREAGFDVEAARKEQRKAPSAAEQLREREERERKFEAERAAIAEATRQLAPKMKPTSAAIWLTILSDFLDYPDEDEARIIHRYVPSLSTEKLEEITGFDDISDEIATLSVEQLAALTFEIIAHRACSPYNTEANDRFFARLDVDFAAICARLTPAAAKPKRKAA
jgi:ParB-like partition proteins